MKQITILILAAALMIFELRGQTTIPTIISGNQTWTPAGNPYTLKANAVLTAGSSLKIMPGVKIIYENNFELSIAGTVEAIGKKDSVITITGNGNGVFFKFTNTAPDHNSITGKGQKFMYCNFTGNQSYGVAIYSVLTGFLVENCRFTSADIDARYTYADSSYVILRNNIFFASNINIDMTYRFLIENCSFELGDLHISETGIITNCKFDKIAGLYCGIESSLGKWIYIKCNTFKNCGGIITTGTIPRINVYRNTFDSSKIFSFDCSHLENELIVKQNNFKNLQKNSIIINGKDFCGFAAGSYNKINLKNNYWGTTDTTIINGAITDYNEDIKIGAKVDYSGFTTSPYTSGCSDEVSIHKGPGIDDLITIYPNPASETVFLKINMNGEKNIKLMNANGRVLFIETTSLKDFSFQVNSIAPGFYFLEISQDENRVFKKLILK